MGVGVTVFVGVWALVLAVVERQWRSGDGVQGGDRNMSNDFTSHYIV